MRTDFHAIIAACTLMRAYVAPTRIFPSALSRIPLFIAYDQRSLARSVKMGRGDRTPEVNEDRRTTVGVDLHSHTLTNGTECKIYDVAGQVSSMCLLFVGGMCRRRLFMRREPLRWEGLAACCRVSDCSR